MKLNAAILDASTLIPRFEGETLLDRHWDLNLTKLKSAVDQLTCFAYTNDNNLLTHARGHSVLITNKVVIGDHHMAMLPDLKLIAIAATGTNNVDLKAAKNRGIAVTNVAAYSTQSVVQICLTLLLNLASKLQIFQNALAKTSWDQQPQFVLLPEAFYELSGKTLGIIGYGTIGKSVADVARSIGMKVVLAGLAGRPEDYNRLPLNKLLPMCDVISLHCPLTEQTAQLVDRDFLSQMKPGALLINTARGGLIDESALAEALLSGKIAGAGLDVLSTEPPDQHNPLLNPAITNLIITPHIGWASFEARQRLVDELAKTISAFAHRQSHNRVV